MRRIITLLLFILATQTVSAAGLSSMTDTVSRHARNKGSDHTVRFLTSAGIVGAGSTFAIQFPAGFNLTTLSLADVSLSYGPITGLEIATSLAALPTATDWGFDKFGQNLTFTHPSVGFGDIGSSQFVVVQLGNGKIINPNVNGSYIVQLYTSAGESGALAIPVANDQVTVTAHVGPGGDTTTSPPPPPPIILTAPDLNLLCPIFRTPAPIGGNKPLLTEVWVNNSNIDVTYSTDSLWQKIVSLLLGGNPFDIYAKYPDATTSPVISGTVIRCEIGDVNCNNYIDDFDLSGLAYHWLQNWCNADFNSDLIVDDFDLAGQAAHWRP